MPQHHSTTTHRAMGTDSGTSGNTNTSSHGRVGTNVHVVTNLNQVVEFDAIANDGVFQCAAINAGIGTNFNIVTNPNGTELFNFFPLTLVQSKSKTICTNDHARMNNATGTNATVFAQSDPRFKDACRTHLSSALNHTQGTDHRIFGNHGRRINDG
jgi:hypothetical protein